MSTYTRIYQRSPEERLADIKMMSDPMGWPMVVLPIKRLTDEVGGRPQFGVMTGDRPTVYLMNMFETHEPTAEETLKYANYEAIFDDGWVVD